MNKLKFKLKIAETNRVKKSGILLVVAGSLIVVGVILSFYGNYMIFEELTKGDGVIQSGKQLIIETELDDTKIQTGIYAVQIIDFNGETVMANVIDPFGTTIASQSINEEVYQGIFDMTSSGNYKLIVENQGVQDVNIFGVIGPEPDSGKKALNFISIYILVIGLVVMAAVAAYIIIKRKKSN